jgi:hypothetical protein
MKRLQSVRTYNDIFGEKHRYKIELPYVLNANINTRLQVAAR